VGVGVGYNARSEGLTYNVTLGGEGFVRTTSKGELFDVRDVTRGTRGL
jgi:hypothetical protein